MRIGLFLFPIWSVKLAPLGLAYISAALRKDGHDVTVEDYNLYVYNKIYSSSKNEDGQWYEFGNKKMEYSGESGKRLVNFIGPYVVDVTKKIVKGNFELIGISLFSSSVKFTELVLRMYKTISPRTKIVIGGPSSTRFDADFFLKHKLADYVVYGEGERAICELVKKIEAGHDPRGIESLKYLDENGEIVTTKRKSQMKPEEFSLPDFSDYNIESYTYNAIPIMMSRGCVAACTFCNETFYWHRYRMGVVQNIGNELKQAVEKFSPNFIFICDSLVNGDHDLLEHLVDFVLEHDLKTSWGGNARFDNRLTYELLKKMKDGGCHVLTFGLESASEKVLKLMGKRINIEIVKEVLTNCSKVGIKANVNILVGFPGEEEVDFQETIKFLLEFRNQIFTINTGFGMEINENTGVYRQPDKYNILLDDKKEIASYMGGWATVDLSNTLEVRTERLNRLRKTLVSQNMKFREEKLYFEEQNILD